MVRDTTNVRTLVDIGANDGAHSEYLSGFFGPGPCTFEPLPSCQSLSALEALPNVTVHQVALAEALGEATFFENGYGPGLVAPAGQRRQSAGLPETERESAVTVALARLDDVLPADTLERDIMIKIDVQGAEDRVIKGGRAVFSAAKIVLVEMAFVPIYQGQPLFEEVHGLLEACGLRLAGFKNQIDEPGPPAVVRPLPLPPTRRPRAAMTAFPLSSATAVPVRLDPRAASLARCCPAESASRSARGRWRSTA